MKRQGLLAINAIVVFLCLIGLWQAVVWLNHLPPYILPGPKLVALALHDRYLSLLNSLWITTEEAAGGLAGSIVVGVATAMIFAQWRWLRQTLYHLFVMHKATPAQILFKLRLPNATPNLFTGIRISAGISVIGALTGELFAGSTRVGEGGLGYAIIYANNQMETSYRFALVLAATVLGFGFFFVVMFLEWVFLHNWHESSLPQISE